VRGGRSLDALDAFAAHCRSAPSRDVVCVAVSVDDAPDVARAYALQTWPHLAHYWTDAKGIAAARVAFVPNRVLLDPSDGQIFRWWDGTNGAVLSGPHGKSRANGSHRGLAAQVDRALDAVHRKRLRRRQRASTTTNEDDEDTPPTTTTSHPPPPTAAFS